MIKNKKNCLPASCILLFLCLTGCEWIHQRKCEWYLMPDETRIGKADEGYIPVCARNLVINKEQCNLQATLEFTEKNYGRKFKSVDMKLDLEGKFPRKILDIKFCEK